MINDIQDFMTSIDVMTRITVIFTQVTQRKLVEA